MFILKLFSILLVSYMVQSLPTTDVCNKTRHLINDAAQSRTAAENKTVILYCAANAVQIIARCLNGNATQLNLTIATENPVTEIVLKTTFQQFSNECKDFTLAMSLKHQLQDSLFRQKNQGLIPHQINRLSSILIYLQTIANSLDDIHSRQQSSHCVRMSAHGYRMMYHVQYNTTSLLTEIETKGKRWVKNESYRKGAGSCTCEVLYPIWNCFFP